MNLRSRLQFSLSDDGEEAYTKAAMELNENKGGCRKRQKELELYLAKIDEKILGQTQAAMDQAEVRYTV